MKIPYLIRKSKFTPLIIKSLKENDVYKEEVKLIFCESRLGYNGEIKVTITQGEDKEFTVDKKFSDPTRFPARIKSAATALKELNLYGEFMISHRDNEIKIRIVRNLHQSHLY